MTDASLAPLVDALSPILVNVAVGTVAAAIPVLGAWGLWLVQKIRDSCEFMPAPVVAREIYCGKGWPPRDGQTMDMLPDVGRRGNVRRADNHEAE